MTYSETQLTPCCSKVNLTSYLSMSR